MDDVPEPLFLKKSLNPMMIPFLELTAGNCQDASVLVEVPAVMLKLSGGPEGTEQRQWNDETFIMKLTYS